MKRYFENLFGGRTKTSEVETSIENAMEFIDGKKTVMEGHTDGLLMLLKVGVLSDIREVEKQGWVEIPPYSVNLKVYAGEKIERCYFDIYIGKHYMKKDSFYLDFEKEERK
ncbi:hypothetical protein ACFLZZ_01260 [Nanoarchaeota archaeon]